MKDISPVDKVMNNLKDKNFVHLNKEERIRATFGLYHGKGKKKKRGKHK